MYLNLVKGAASWELCHCCYYGSLVLFHYKVCQREIAILYLWLGTLYYTSEMNAALG